MSDSLTDHASPAGRTELRRLLAIADGGSASLDEHLEALELLADAVPQMLDRVERLEALLRRWRFEQHGETCPCKLCAATVGEVGAAYYPEEPT